MYPHNIEISPVKQVGNLSSNAIIKWCRFRWQPQWKRSRTVSRLLLRIIQTACKTAPINSGQLGWKCEKRSVEPLLFSFDRPICTMKPKLPPSDHFPFPVSNRRNCPGCPSLFFQSICVTFPSTPPSRSNSNEYQELESFWKKERKRENMQIAFIISGFPGDSEEIEMEILRSSRAFFFTLILWLLKSCRSMRF